MEASSSQQEENEICYKFENVQADGHLTVKKYIGVVDNELHIADSNMKLKNVGSIFNKRNLAANW